MVSWPENVPMDVVVDSQDSMAPMYIHAYLAFGGRVDADRLARAVRMLAHRAPILACGYQLGGVASSWTWAPAEALAGMYRCEDFETRSAALAAIHELTVADPSALAPPLMRALLARAPDGDRLALKISHIVADAGGVKELVYLLAEAYRELGRNPQWSPGPAALGPRGVRQLLAGLGLRGWRRLLKASVREDRIMYDRSSVAQFVPEDRGQPAYVTEFLDRDLMAALKARGAKSGAKLNDLLVASFVRAQARLGPTGDRFVVPFTVDLRRYLDSEQVVVSNISSIINIVVPRSVTGSFDQTLAHVCAETRFYKAHFIGLAGTVRALIVSALMPAGLRSRFLRWLWCAVSDRGLIGPAFTNLGVVDEARSDFGDIALIGVSVGAPIARSGRFICSASGYAGTVTLHLGCLDGGDPQGLVARLGRLWREELELATA